jgi:hypothetical protein
VIPDRLHGEIVEHDVDDSLKTCPAGGSPPRPMGYDGKLELKYTPAKFEEVKHCFFPKDDCDTRKGALRRQSGWTQILGQLRMVYGDRVPERCNQPNQFTPKNRSRFFERAPCGICLAGV